MLETLKNHMWAAQASAESWGSYNTPEACENVVYWKGHVEAFKIAINLLTGV